MKKPNSDQISGNLQIISTYYKSITLVECKNSCTSPIMNGLQVYIFVTKQISNEKLLFGMDFRTGQDVVVLKKCNGYAFLLMFQGVIKKCSVIVNSTHNYFISLRCSFNDSLKLQSKHYHKKNPCITSMQEKYKKVTF